MELSFLELFSHYNFDIEYDRLKENIRDLRLQRITRDRNPIRELNSLVNSINRLFSRQKYFFLLEIQIGHN
jgi:hypothetical protein